jgi:hypothetical protein
MPNLKVTGGVMPNPREIPKTVIKPEGDRFIVSLPNGTIEYAKSVEQAKRLANNRWLAPGVHPPGSGVPFHTIEFVDCEDPDKAK